MNPQPETSNMKQALKSPIIRTTLLTIVGCIFVPGIISGFLALNHQIQNSHSNYHQNLQQSAKLLAAAASDTLWDLNPTNTKALLASAIGLPGVNKIEILDVNAHIFSSITAPETVGTVLELYTVPITHNQETLGKLSVYFSDQAVHIDWYKDSLQLFAAMALTATISSVLIFFYLRRNIIGRLKRLTAQASDLRQGIMGTSFIWGNADEIDQVGSAMDSARVTILESFSKLDDLNSKLYSQNLELEKKVGDKTSALIHAARLASVGEMATGVAHEINNPLTVINGRVELLKKKLERGPVDSEILRATLLSIGQMGDRITKIVKGLLSYGRHQDSDEMVVTQITTIVSETLDLYIQKMKNHGINFFMDEVKDTFILCHPIQISQVMVNLINNSIDATSELDDKWIKILIENKYEDSMQFWEVRFQDSGPGIPPEYQAKMMNPFFTTKEVGKGTGLGLSISRNIMASHNGQLIYDPLAPHTTFILKLPCYQIQKKQAA